jgi:hypothetical protein
MFALWHAYNDGRLDRSTLVLRSVPIRSRMSKCLQQYSTCSDSDVRKAAKSLLKHWNGLFIFLEQEGVEPTNNSAERGERPAVQWQKSASVINPTMANASPPDCRLRNDLASSRERILSTSFSISSLHTAADYQDLH